MYTYTNMCTNMCRYMYVHVHVHVHAHVHVHVTLCTYVYASLPPVLTVSKPQTLINPNPYTLRPTPLSPLSMRRGCLTPTWRSAAS